jgi:nicotinamide-nucleotide amidase
MNRENQELEKWATRAGERLLARKEMLATAESCTGGWVAQCLTSLAGASLWFERGFVVYSNAAKVQMLGVAEKMLTQYGAVSEPVASAMAQGAITHSPAQWSLAITGIAGPGGGSPEKPVGTVCFAWGHRGACCTEDIHVTARTCHFDGDRTSIRQQAVILALEGLLERLV